VGHALLQAITSPGRSAAVRPTSAKAAFTTTDARHLGIRERLASYDVPVPGGGAALSAAAQHLDGIVLRPGSSLSLRGRLGGSTPDGAGGNALATAFFNAAWLGGLQVTAHATPASYAGTVSPGRDASLRNGHDLVVRDDTRSGVLVSATVRGGRLTVTLWSTKHWTVTSRHGARSHVVVAGRRVDHGPGCRPRAGRDGFQVTVTRTFARSGHADRASSYTVRYSAVPAVVCHAHHHGHHHHGHHHGHRHH
jgi:vancomycin resistance protein YoaR